MKKRDWRITRGAAVAALFLSSLVTISATPAQAATNYEALQLSVSTIGREGGSLEVSVVTALPNNEMQTTDTAILTNGCLNVLAINSAPTIVSENGKSYANYRLSVPESSVGCLQQTPVQGPSGSSSYTTSSFYVNILSGAPPVIGTYFGAPWTAGALYTYGTAFFGGVPTKVDFGPSQSDPFGTISAGINTYSANLYDANGVPTLMLGDQSMTIAPSASLQLQTTAGSNTLGAAGQSATIANTNLNSLLNYGIQVGRPALVTGSVAISTTGSWGTLSPSAVTLPAMNAPSANAGVLAGTDASASYAIASGSDGFLYVWGYLIPQPIKLTIPSGCTVQQIIGMVVLDSCGYVWHFTQNFPQSGKPTLQRVPVLNSTGLGVKEMTGSGNFFLLSDNSIVRTGLYQNSKLAVPIDTTALGSDTPVAIRTSVFGNNSSLLTLFIIGASGNLYSAFDNSAGAAGQGSNTGTVAMTRVLFGSEPDTATVLSMDSSQGAEAAILSDGTFWGWGDNSQGYAGKDSTQITQLNSPALIPLPISFAPTRVSGEFGQSYFHIYGTNQSAQQVNYSFQNGNWVLGTTNLIHDLANPNWWGGSLSVDSTGAVSSSVNGNCGDSSTRRISSLGQFGPAYSYDALVVSAQFVQDGNTVTTVAGNSVNEVAGRPFALQFSGVHTRCYPSATQLIVAWDLVGNGNYSTPATLVQANTGYSVFQASLNYANAGRYKVGLQVSTPSGNTYTTITTIGVDAATSTQIPSTDSRTVVVSTSSSHTLSIGSDGLVYAWGDNSCDQLGIAKATYSNINIPTLVSSTDTNKAVTVTAGIRSSYVIDTAGQVYAWGESPGPNSAYSGVSPTLISELSNTPIRDIAAGINGQYSCDVNDVSLAKSYGFANLGTTVALTTIGRLLTWNDTASVSSVPGAAGLIFDQIVTASNILYALDSQGNVWTWNGTGALSQISGISGVLKLRGGMNAVVAIMPNGAIQAETNGINFGSVSLPNNVTLVDAQPGQNNQIIGVGADGNLYTASLSYANQAGIQTLTTSTWYQSAQTASASSSDLPVTQPKSDSFISFASNRVASTQGWNGYGGSCGINNGTFSRVISNGQFGTAYNPDTISVGSLTATIGTNAAVNVVRGGLIAAAGGTPIVIRAQRITSQCYASNLTISADVTGSGTFTNLTLSNENGTYSYIVPTVVPNSGRSVVTIRAQALSGLSLTFTLNIASYATTEYPNITARNQPFYTSNSFGLAVGSDGFAYGWANDKTFNYMINPTPPFSSFAPTKVTLVGNPQINDVAGALSGNYQGYGVLIADATGKVWAWGSSASADLPITTSASGSTPITPTRVAGLNGVNVKRLSVSSSGSAVAALASTGVVYIWNSNYRTPVPVSSLAGLNIVDIRMTDQVLYAITSTGDTYSSGGNSGGWQDNSQCIASPAGANLSDASQACLQLRKLPIDPIQSLAPSTSGLGGLEGAIAVSTTGKVYLWGYFNGVNNLTPTQIAMPDSKVPASVGLAFRLPQVIAADGTWLSLTQLANGTNALISTEQFLPSIQVTMQNVTGFSEGDGSGVKLSDGRIYTSGQSVAGSCSVDQPWFNRVMSDSQFGASYHTDSIEISASGPQLFRPGVATAIDLTATSVCSGGLGITFDHKILGESNYSGTITGSPTYNQSSSTAIFNFTPTTNGANWITFRATNANGISGTYQFEADVVPAPPAGRLIGVSINEGARYTNSRDVTIDLVWPDGTLVAYVSNDGGFVPGTFSAVPLQSKISWQLPPQAVVPLPAIVYARYGDANAITYFDDIIMDSLSPILTYASATPNP